MKKTLTALFTITAFFPSAFSQCPSPVTDIDGNVYNVVQIGSQCWMQENLNTSHYKNGAAIVTGYRLTENVKNKCKTFILRRSKSNKRK